MTDFLARDARGEPEFCNGPGRENSNFPGVRPIVPSSRSALDAAGCPAYNPAHDAKVSDHPSNYLPGALTHEPPGQGAWATRAALANP